jgi:hypothetical protein
LAPGIEAIELPPEKRMAHDVAVALARLGPRTGGGEGHARAIDFLSGEMKRVGLRVSVVPADERGEGPHNLEGVLAGTGSREIVLTAHYDTVAGSPGAGDDASGCGVVLAAASLLRETPLRHTVRVVLFDREEDGLKGSRAWLRERTTLERKRIHAVLNVEMVGWRASRGPVVHTFPVTRSGRMTVAPGWLVESLLETGRKIDWPVTLTDPVLGVFGQLVLRSTRPAFAADSDAFLAAGVPALFVSDTSLTSFDPAYHRRGDSEDRLDADRLNSWTKFVVAAVRRLDAFDSYGDGPDDRYLVAVGRLWSRSALVAGGIPVCGVVILAAIGLRRRKFARSAARARWIGNPLVSAICAALAVVTAPVFSSVLILPVLPLTLLRPRTLLESWLLRLCAASPGLILLALVGWSVWAGWTRPVVPSLAALPLAVGLITFYFTLAPWKSNLSATAPGARSNRD